VKIPATPDYRDCPSGLDLSGIFEVLLGFLCALAIPFLFFAQTIASRRPDAAPAPPTFIPLMTVYALMAVAFIWHGFGSILARRRAPAILSCLAGVALCAGLMGEAWVALTPPHLGAAMAQLNPPAPPAAAFLVVKIMMAVVILAIFVLIPGALLLFSRNPRVNCGGEASYAMEEWTDRCPLPVLALSLAMAFFGIGILGLLGGLHGFAPFGVFVSGGPRYFLPSILAALLLYLALGLFRLQIQAWWIALGMQLIFAIYGAVMFSRGNFAALYLKFGLDPRTAAAAGQLLRLPAFKWLIPISIVPWLMWLLCIRLYFPAATASPALSKRTG
jgi:hypothetical protein